MWANVVADIHFYLTAFVGSYGKGVVSSENLDAWCAVPLDIPVEMPAIIKRDRVSNLWSELRILLFSWHVQHFQEVLLAWPRHSDVETWSDLIQMNEGEWKSGALSDICFESDRHFAEMAPVARRFVEVGVSLCVDPASSKMSEGVGDADKIKRIVTLALIVCAAPALCIVAREECMWADAATADPPVSVWNATYAQLKNARALCSKGSVGGLFDLSDLIEFAFKAFSAQILQSLSRALDSFEKRTAVAQERANAKSLRAMLADIDSEAITKRRAKTFFKVCIAEEAHALCDVYARVKSAKKKQSWR